MNSLVQNANFRHKDAFLEAVITLNVAEIINQIEKEEARFRCTPTFCFHEFLFTNINVSWGLEFCLLVNLPFST